MGKAIEAITKPITTLIGGAEPKAPKVIAPAVMPTPDDKAVQDARRRRLAAGQATSGRLSTLLSGGDRETLG